MRKLPHRSHSSFTSSDSADSTSSNAYQGLRRLVLDDRVTGKPHIAATSSDGASFMPQGICVWGYSLLIGARSVIEGICDSLDTVHVPICSWCSKNSQARTRSTLDCFSTHQNTARIPLQEYGRKSKLASCKMPYPNFLIKFNVYWGYDTRKSAAAACKENSYFISRLAANHWSKRS